MLSPYPSNVLVCQRHKNDSCAQVGFMADTRMRYMTAKGLQHNLYVQAPDKLQLKEFKVRGMPDIHKVPTVCCCPTQSLITLQPTLPEAALIQMWCISPVGKPRAGSAVIY